MASTREGWRARPDLSLLLITLALVALGILMVLSASAPAAQVQMHDSLFFFKKQLMWGVLGLGAGAIGMALPLERIRAWSRPMLVLSGLLLIATQIPGLGVTVYGATRWLRLGPFTLQPSELAKLALVIYLADVLARFPDHRWTLRELRQALLPVGGMLGLILFQPDLGTTLTAAFMIFALFWANGTRVWLIGTWAMSGVAGVLALSLSVEYQRLRWLAFMDPWKYPKDIGFQLIQSLLAIGSGGILGTGWGQGKQKLFYLPIQHADFIFAVLAEELGLIGTVLTVALFLLFAQRGFSIARRSQNPFHQLLCVGITTLIAAQAFLNIGVVTASLPTTGIPLPFVSAGGTSLLITLFAVGLVLNVSRSSQVHMRLLSREAAREGA